MLPQKVKQKKYRYYVINIKIRRIDSKDDISSEDYARLFYEFYLSGTIGKSSKQKACILISNGNQVIDDKQVAFGQIAQVTRINNKRWFNLTKNEVDEAFKVPKEYAANANITDYIFIPQIHRFCYRYKSSDFIAPYSVRTYLQNALGEFFQDRGYFAQIDVVSDPASIEQIYSALAIRSLEININYSNNDFGDDFQKFVEDDLRDSNVGEFDIIAKHKQGNSINLERSKILAGALKSSVANGEVTARIIDEDGKKVTVKTKDSPLKIEVTTTEDNKNSAIYNAVTNEAAKDDQPHN